MIFCAAIPLPLLEELDEELEELLLEDEELLELLELEEDELLDDELLLLELEEELELDDEELELLELEEDELPPPPPNTAIRALFRLEPELMNAVSTRKGNTGVVLLVENKKPFL